LSGGWIGRLLGGPFVGLAWPLFFACGLLMTMILVGAVLGWPIMFATVSTESSDGFDGFSRTYNFVYGWPWHYGWNCTISLLYAVLGTAFFAAVIDVACYLTVWSVELGLGSRGTSMVWVETFGDGVERSRRLGSVLGLLWMNLLNLLALAFAYSFFWTAFTINYFLMRERDDGTPLTDVYIPEEHAEDDMAPVVGTAASAQPVMERPAPMSPGADPTVDRASHAEDGSPVDNQES